MLKAESGRTAFVAPDEMFLVESGLSSVESGKQMTKMKLLFFALTFAATCVFAQVPAPSLEQIKIAADAGDPAAQDKLAEKFMSCADSGLMWT
ncbi:MAG: hypothetical protein WBW41_10555 [Verrucomicrobiia bacterium]